MPGSIAHSCWCDADTSPSSEAPATTHHTYYSHEDYNERLYKHQDQRGPASHAQNPGTSTELPSFKLSPYDQPAKASQGHPTLPPWTCEDALYPKSASAERIHPLVRPERLRDNSFSASWRKRYSLDTPKSMTLRNEDEITFQNTYGNSFGPQPLFEAVDFPNSGSQFGATTTNMESERATFSATISGADYLTLRNLTQNVPEASQHHPQETVMDQSAETIMHVPIGAQSSQRAARSSHRPPLDLAPWNPDGYNQQKFGDQNGQNYNAADSARCEITNHVSAKVTPVATMVIREGEYSDGRFFVPVDGALGPDSFLDSTCAAAAARHSQAVVPVAATHYSHVSALGTSHNLGTLGNKDHYSMKALGAEHLVYPGSHAYSGTIDTESCLVFELLYCLSMLNFFVGIIGAARFIF